MANYVSIARTSYFKVKDEDAFWKWISEFPNPNIWQKNTDDGDLLCLAFEIGIPTWRELEDGTDEDINFFEEIAKHLASGWAVEIREIGFEGMRYLIGRSTIVCWDGKAFTVSLDDAVRLAPVTAEMKLTPCEY